jgi:hypothetical protein
MDTAILILLILNLFLSMMAVGTSAQTQEAVKEQSTTNSDPFYRN